jgi:serine/threonine protein kinase
MTLDKNGKIEEDEARVLFRQIVRALDYCKRKKICHRDLKPENILIDKGKIKVSDFGLSALYKDKNDYTHILHTTCGTINYLAPEVNKRKCYNFLRLCKILDMMAIWLICGPQELYFISCLSVVGWFFFVDP